MNLETQIDFPNHRELYGTIIFNQIVIKTTITTQRYSTISYVISIGAGLLTLKSSAASGGSEVTKIDN